MPGYLNIHESDTRNLTSWGNYPVVESSVFMCNDEQEARSYILNEGTTIPRGNGRSYGDSALGKNVINLLQLNKFISFDDQSGILHCESGVLLEDIVRIFLPQGWFLRVTPGTKLITVGGAIASDIHGKNHHQAGCFSSNVLDFRLLLSDGTCITCAPDQNSEIFRATCGGMGLTGIILDSRIKLQQVTSRNILQQTIKSENLQSTFDLFDKHELEPYSVAWIDSLASEKNLGRCLFMKGDFACDGNLNYSPSKSLNIPFYFPVFCLNTMSVKAFNYLYYNKIRDNFIESTVSVDAFFYPLDAVNNWNRIYGRQGFTQYQFVLPKEKSFDGLREILIRIHRSGQGSFLAVLKLFGKENENYLSFPCEGYTLALDFKVSPGIFRLLEELDKIVLSYNGRIYLSKDVRMNTAMFRKGYEKLDGFLKIRKELRADAKFISLQSIRLQL